MNTYFAAALCIFIRVNNNIHDFSSRNQMHLAVYPLKYQIKHYFLHFIHDKFCRSTCFRLLQNASKNHKNPLAAGALPQTPLGELTALPQTPLSDFPPQTFPFPPNVRWCRINTAVFHKRTIQYGHQ